MAGRRLGDWKVGDVAIVVRENAQTKRCNTNDLDPHGFEIGARVHLQEYDSMDNSWRASEKGDSYWVFWDCLQRPEVLEKELEKDVAKALESIRGALG